MQKTTAAGVVSSHILALDRAQVAYATASYQAALAELEGADDRDPSVRYLKALCFLALDRPISATGLLEQLVREPVVPDEAFLDLALAYLACQRINAASESVAEFLVRRPSDSVGRYLRDHIVAIQQDGSDKPSLAPVEPRINSAVVNYVDGEGTSVQEAGHVYQPFGDYGDGAVLAADLPSGPFTSSARDPSSSGNSQRPWNLSLLTAYEYDTNLPQIDDFTGLGSDVDKDDSRGLVAAFGEYRLLQTIDSTVGLLGTVFSNFHFDQDSFDLQSYNGGVYGNRLAGPFIFSGYYQFVETILGGDELSQEHRLTPSVSLLQGTVGHVTGYYEYNTADVRGPVLVPAQARDAQVHSVGATQAFYLFGGRGRLYFGYRFDNAEADGDDFDRVGHHVSARAELPLGRRLVADLDVRQFWDDYPDPNSLDFFGRPRIDRRTEVRAGLQLYCTCHLSQRLDYTFVNNDSNVTNLFGVQFFEYERDILSTQLIYDF